MSDPKYAYPYPAQGHYEGPPVMAPPPQYAAPPPQYAAPPPRPGFLEGCLAALRCCCLIEIPRVVPQSVLRTTMC
ncbi:hypothetical protein ES319_A05G421100v1 [Gossypium barbadense]|uniref:Cysteine-rich transmembrane domain-containing protein n=1 Tax=Gossypium barbadense TaxID=3634 RepID=A0A5J5W351_GOSBA|nr:hypothetical protein ES319_A05G421100v1 [Gossypium barbadense]